jgi:hypothetical protein
MIQYELPEVSIGGYRALLEEQGEAAALAAYTEQSDLVLKLGRDLAVAVARRDVAWSVLLRTSGIA